MYLILILLFLRRSSPTVICLTANSYGPGLAVFAFPRCPRQTKTSLRPSNPDEKEAVPFLRPYK